MKKFLVFLVAISIQLCCFSLAFSASFEETKRAADQGDADAQFNMGAMYYDGEGVQQDYQKAKQWYEKAAEKKDANAQYILGFMYEKGHGVRQDLATAKEWYGKACDNGKQDGCDAYARLNR